MPYNTDDVNYGNYGNTNVNPTVDDVNYGGYGSTNSDTKRKKVSSPVNYVDSNQLPVNNRIKFN